MARTASKVGKPVLSVVEAEVRSRFARQDALRVLSALEAAQLPFLKDESHVRERARVHLAVLKLANGSLAEFEKWLGEARTDWRDVLMAAGMANNDWRTVLGEAGFRVPESL